MLSKVYTQVFHKQRETSNWLNINIGLRINKSNAKEKFNKNSS